jgi:hypothetical protein
VHSGIAYVSGHLGFYAASLGVSLRFEERKASIFNP